MRAAVSAVTGKLTGNGNWLAFSALLIWLFPQPAVAAEITIVVTSTYLAPDLVDPLLYQVEMELDEDSMARLATFSAANVDRQTLVCIDDLELARPFIREPLRDLLILMSVTKEEWFEAMMRRNSDGTLTLRMIVLD